MIDSSLLPSPHSSTLSNTSNSCILKVSPIQLKKGIMSVRRTAILVAPKSVSDIQQVYETFFVLENNKTLDYKTIPCLGHIALAAVKGNFFYKRR